MASEIEEKKTLIDSACRTAKDFINIYYEKIDKNRNALAKLYLDKQGGGNGATLSWNGNRIDGKFNFYLLCLSVKFQNFSAKRSSKNGSEVEFL